MEHILRPNPVTIAIDLSALAVGIYKWSQSYITAQQFGLWYAGVNIFHLREAC
jgi:hypothetical protein